MAGRVTSKLKASDKALTQTRRILSAPLSSEQRDQYGVKTLPIRKGDSVKIIRGDFSGIEGKVSEVNLKGRRIYVEGVTREKASGTSVKVGVHPSKVTITKLNLDDKWRRNSLETQKRRGEET